jgi:hypothetical protein
MLPKAAPIMIPTAMSRTFPLMANSLNSSINPVLLPPNLLIYCGNVIPLNI